MSSFLSQLFHSFESIDEDNLTVAQQLILFHEKGINRSMRIPQAWVHERYETNRRSKMTFLENRVHTCVRILDNPSTGL